MSVRPPRGDVKRVEPVGSELGSAIPTGVAALRVDVWSARAGP